MKETRWIAIALALGLAACGSEETDTSAESETPAAEAPPAEAEETPAEEAAEEPAEEAAEQAPAEDVVAEGEAPAEGEGTPCEQAFASVQALREQLEERMGGQNQAPPLDRDAYLESCNALPAGAQQCMILGYAAEHQEECAEFQSQIQNAQH